MRAGKLLKLAAPKYVEDQPAQYRSDLIVGLNSLLQAADNFNADMAAAEDNRELSPEGLLVAQSRVAKAALATLVAVEGTTIKTLTERVSTVEKQMLDAITYSPSKDAAERTSHELHLQEIRNQLREIPAEQRLSVYLTATDALTLHAIETAPPTLSAPRPDGTRKLEPFVDAEQKSAAMHARAAATNPTAAKTLAELRGVRQVYTLAVNGLRTEILAEAPDAVPVAVPVMR
jgi:hypothetical protein